MLDRFSEAPRPIAATMRIHAATYELLVMLRQFDAQQGWGHGFRSCAHWLSWCYQVVVHVETP